MIRLITSFSALAFFLVSVQPFPFSVARHTELSGMKSHGQENWRDTLSKDTSHRLDLALQHLDDKTEKGQVFRNDTIMRVNIEREALDLSLIDLSQAFNMKLPETRASVFKTYPERRSEVEDDRELTYTRGGAMTYPNVVKKRSEAQDDRELTYTRGGAMTYPNAIEKRSEAQDDRELTYTRGGAMTYPKIIEKRDNDDYDSLLDRKNLAVGAIERINVAHRIQGRPEITEQEAQEMASHSDDYVSGYWSASMKHGQFWETDQVVGKPNFIEGGQVNGYGFIQSTYHKLHCLANIRMILSWHITGNSDKMTRDMNVHTIHCLEYIRSRELDNSDLNEEPIDTVDYKGMGIH